MPALFVVQASRELMGLLCLASLQALKGGRGEVGTEDVLSELVKGVPPLSSVLEVDARRLQLVIMAKRGDARSSWKSAETDHSQAIGELECEVDATFREVDWYVRLKRRLRSTHPVPSSSGAVRGAVRSAFRRAQSYGRRYVSPLHLLAGLLDVPDCRAVELLEELGCQPDRVRSRLPVDIMKQEGLPSSAAITVLEGTGQLAGINAELVKPVRWLTSAVAALARAESGFLRRGGFKPMLSALDEEASRLAVRYGAAYVTQAYYLLAVFLVQRHLDQHGLRLAARWSPHNEAGDLLRYAGVTEQPLTRSVLQAKGTEATMHRRRPWGAWTSALPPFGQSVIAATARADEHAARLGHIHAGTSHILLALLEEQGAATHVLRALGIDISRLKLSVETALRASTHQR